MSSAKTIFKNASFLLIADVIGRVLSFFLIVAIARYLGDVGLGKYSFIFAFIGLFAIFTDFGLKTLMVRDVARDKEKTKQYLGNILALKIIFSVVVLIVAAIIVNFVNKSPDVTISIYIIAIATFFLGIGEVFCSLLQAYEKMEYMSLINIVERIATAGLGIAILTAGAKLIGLILVFLFSYLLVFIISAIIVNKKIIKIRLSMDINFWKVLLKESLPFWFTILFVTIYFRIDSVMLSMMKGYEAVGWYSASYKMLDALYFIPGAVIMAVFPVMSKFHLKDIASLSKVYRNSFYYLFSLGIAIAVGTTLLADRIILFVYTEQFKNSIIALQILIWAEMIIFVSSLSGYLLNSIDKQKLFTYTAAFCAVVNIVLNYILISKYSYVGAAISTLVTEGLAFSILFYFVSKSGHGFNILKFVPKVGIASIGMALFITYFNFLHLLVLIPISGLVYYLVLYLVKGVGKEEINLVKSIFKRE
jgi:O-antigen/teichoic acid export membrane protein